MNNIILIQFVKTIHFNLSEENLILLLYNNIKI